MITYLKVFWRLLLTSCRLMFAEARWLDDPLFLQAAYRAFFGREPDDAGYKYYLAELQQRRLNRVGLLKSMIGSSEFRRHYSLISQPTDVHLYTHVIKAIPKYNFSICVSTMDTAIGWPLVLDGVHEETVTNTLVSMLKRDTHFLDIGANIGYYTLLVASQCSQGKIYSFEPDTHNFQLLKTSIAYNSFESMVTAYHLAVSDTNTTIVVSDLGNSPNSGARFTGPDEMSLRPYIHGPDPYFRQIEAVNLDCFLPEARIDLIKIDIEGHEPFALRGMIGLLKRNRPVVFAEFAPNNLLIFGKTQPEEFLSFFIALNYEVNVISRNGLLNFDSDIEKVLAYHHEQNTHHLDLLLNPK